MTVVVKYNHLEPNDRNYQEGPRLQEKWLWSTQIAAVTKDDPGDSKWPGSKKKRPGTKKKKHDRSDKKFPKSPKTAVVAKNDRGNQKWSG